MVFYKGLLICVGSWSVPLKMVNSSFGTAIPQIRSVPPPASKINEVMAVSVILFESNIIAVAW